MAWLPLKPELRKESTYDPEALTDWVSSLQDTKYSFVKEFFAAIDDTRNGWPTPFNNESVPISLRLLEKYWISEHTEEFLEGLLLRYHALASEQGDHIDSYQHPKSI